MYTGMPGGDDFTQDAERMREEAGKAFPLNTLWILMSLADFPVPLPRFGFGVSVCDVHFLRHLAKRGASMHDTHCCGRLTTLSSSSSFPICTDALSLTFNRVRPRRRKVEEQE